MAACTSNADRVCPGPVRQDPVPLCQPGLGREVALVSGEALTGTRFVHIPGDEAPSLWNATRVPKAIRGAPVDAFMAAHPGGYGPNRFADLDGDGDLDVVAPQGGSGSKGTLVSRNLGQGTFAAWQELRGGYFAEVCDVDGDGDLDVVSPTSTYGGESHGLFINNGAGALADEGPARLPPGLADGAVACADLDGDGGVDIVSVTWGGEDRLLRNDGSGRFAATALPGGSGPWSRWVRAGDLDRDGRLDLVVGGRVLLNRLGGFAPAPTQLPAGDLLSGALGDLDGDGDLDLAVGRLGRVHLRLNDGSGDLSIEADDRLGPRVVPPSSTNFLSIGDFDLDGDLDLEVVEGNPAVLFNTRFSPAADSQPPRLELLEPADGAAIASMPPRLRVAFSDAESGVWPGTLRVFLNGEDVTPAVRLLSEEANASPDALAYVQGWNTVAVEVRDVAGNGLRRETSFLLDSGARPFSTHLSAWTVDGEERTQFAPGEPIVLEVRFRNGGAASLPIGEACSGADVRAWDSAGKLAWLPLYLCPGASFPLLVPPCAEHVEYHLWRQERLFSFDETRVEPGRYEVRACHRTGLAGYRPPGALSLLLGR